MDAIPAWLSITKAPIHNLPPYVGGRQHKACPDVSYRAMLKAYRWKKGFTDIDNLADILHISDNTIVHVENANPAIPYVLYYLPTVLKLYSFYGDLLNLEYKKRNVRSKVAAREYPSRNVDLYNEFIALAAKIGKQEAAKQILKKVEEKK